MLAEQGGVCAVCGHLDPAGRELAVDHDHSCCPDAAKSCGNCVRGLLCWPCNVGIGHLRDDPEILTAAAAYLAA
ncbi:endonuclease domain-containing protein [Streptomyces sp. bgisy159]|uniref:endonuclease domain-containing protein n=1 Tax=Streptomyces sp. bgisy159 TaxID=3413795 RepID=UPI003F4A796D